MGVLRRGEEDLSSEVAAAIQERTVGKQCPSHGYSRAEAIG